MTGSIAIPQDQTVPAAANDVRGIGGHPRGLTTLFFTEMWERFSYYGMKAILVLYVTAAVASGGLNFSERYAGIVIGTYTSAVYWTPLIGGWLADRYLGTRLAVLIGGIIIACGHFSMAFHPLANFYLGLILIVLGTGLLKPNMSTMVGQLYRAGDPRRDAGFSIFYMGINIGALIAPLVCGFLAQSGMFKHAIAAMGLNPTFSWHYGFAAAGFGMILGLIQYVLSGDRLKGIGGRPSIHRAALGQLVSEQTPHTNNSISNGPLRAPVIEYAISETKQDGGTDLLTWTLAILGGAQGAIFYWLDGGRGLITFLFPTVIGLAFGYVIGTVRHLRGQELKRVLAIFILFVFSIVFWMSFEQGGTSLNLFADRLTRTSIFGFSCPSSWFQAVQPAFVIALAPVFAWVWVRLGRRDLSSPAKFALGLLFAGLAFALVAYASKLTGHGKVSPLWLVAVYLLQTVGELCLSPVGLSTVTKLAPARIVGLMMGVWFLSISFGDFIAGWSLRFFNEKAEGALVHLFGIVAGITFAAAAVLFLLTPLIRRLIPREAEAAGGN